MRWKRLMLISREMHGDQPNTRTSYGCQRTRELVQGGPRLLTARREMQGPAGRLRNAAMPGQKQ
jgi:hypothetical protein